MKRSYKEDSFRLMRVFFLFAVPIGLFFTSCGKAPPSARQVPSKKLPVANSFAYPIGEKLFVTEAKDSKDNWFNAQDLGENDHLGEDWNANSGGNSDCGEPVFASATGEITFAKDAGAGWGNVVIITHHLPDGKKVQTLYGHLEKILRSSGEVKKREKIGTVGNANEKYLCHLHFELRDETCPMWDKTGGGYDSNNKGWLDPSDFIDAGKPVI